MITKLKQELENFKSLNLFRCPKCGKIFEWDNARYFPEDKLYECPKCLASVYEDALEQVNVIDYFEELYYLLYELMRRGHLSQIKLGNAWLVNLEELYDFFKTKEEE